jgi:hypothetical protein
MLSDFMFNICNVFSILINHLSHYYRLEFIELYNQYRRFGHIQLSQQRHVFEVFVSNLFGHSMPRHPLIGGAPYNVILDRILDRPQSIAVFNHISDFGMDHREFALGVDILRVLDHFRDIFLDCLINRKPVVRCKAISDTLPSSVLYTCEVRNYSMDNILRFVPYHFISPGKVYRFCIATTHDGSGFFAHSTIDFIDDIFGSKFNIGILPLEGSKTTNQFKCDHIIITLALRGDGDDVSYIFKFIIQWVPVVAVRSVGDGGSYYFI